MTPKEQVTQEHTLEPWVVEAYGSIMAADETICHTSYETGPREPNMRRIVACVNACAGLSTEDLEELDDGTLFTALHRLMGWV